MIKLVIFDLDGTLLDTIGVITKALNKSFLEYGVETKTEEEVRNRVGYGARKLIGELTEGLPENIREEIYVKNRIYSDELAFDSEMFEGIQELLDELAKRNIKIAINTNKSHNRAVLTAEKIFSKWNFCDVIGLSEGDKGKPDPENALKIIENANVSLDEAIYVGDMIVDYNTAKNANIKIALCDWGFENREDLLKLDYDCYLEKPMDLIKYI